MSRPNREIRDEIREGREEAVRRRRRAARRNQRLDSSSEVIDVPEIVEDLTDNSEENVVSSSEEDNVEESTEEELSEAESEAEEERKLDHRILNLMRVKRFNPDRDIDYEMCGICRNNFKKREKVRVLFCGHEFHLKCIDPWLLNHNNSCPMCRHVQ